MIEKRMKDVHPEAWFEVRRNTLRHRSPIWLASRYAKLLSSGNWGDGAASKAP